MADIQISATGGDVTEQTSIQIRRGSTVADSPPVEDDVEQFSAHEELNEDPLYYEDPVMHISGAGHWSLEGWIGDHAVDFLVDSGSSVTAMSDIFYKNLVHAGAPVGALQITARTLRSANGTGIEVLGCSSCSVSFLGFADGIPHCCLQWGGVNSATSLIYHPDCPDNFSVSHRSSILVLADRGLFRVNPKFGLARTVSFTGQLLFISNYPLPHDEAIRRRFKIFEVTEDIYVQEEEEVPQEVVQRDAEVLTQTGLSAEEAYILSD